MKTDLSLGLRLGRLRGFQVLQNSLYHGDRTVGAEGSRSGRSGFEIRAHEITATRREGRSRD